MSVTRIEVLDERPYAAGRQFGSRGPATIRHLVLHHEVDPGHPANARVADLDIADRTADGQVSFDHDVIVIEPADAENRCGWAVVDIVNRGRATAPTYLHLDDTPALPPPPEPPAGDGWLLSQGWTMVLAGWQFDVTHPRLLGMRAPPVAPDRPPTGWVEYTMFPISPVTRLSLNLPGHTPYPVHDADEATLEIERLGEDNELVPRSSWAFGADGRTVELAGGFEPGATYRCRYEATGAVAAGVGLLALRDVVPWLRSGGRGDERALLFGVSQCGRVLRQFLSDGFNRDEAGDRVYDAMLPLIAGGRLGAFNQRFGVPGALPFDETGLTAEPRYGSLLALSDEVDVAPRVIAVNTSTEYWRGDAALVHDDPHPSVRVHHIGGTQHSAGVVPQMFSDPYFGTKGQHGFNTVDYRPVVRALVDQLRCWVDDGIEPSDSVVPTAAQLTDRASVLDRFQERGVAVPDPDSFGLPSGPVPAVDATGNEFGGIRLPDVAAPIGTHTGWNVRHPDIGAPHRQLLLRGSTWWWSERLSLEDHLARVAEVVDRLVAQRLIREDDRDLVVLHAEQRWREAGVQRET